MSQRVGVGVERLQEWGYAAVQAGASQETLEDALKDFGKHMTEIATGMDTTSKAATLFDALGIKMKDAAGNMRSVEDVSVTLPTQYKETRIRRCEPRWQWPSSVRAVASSYRC